MSSDLFRAEHDIPFAEKEICNLTYWIWAELEIQIFNNTAVTSNQPKHMSLFICAFMSFICPTLAIGTKYKKKKVISMNETLIS